MNLDDLKCVMDVTIEQYIRYRDDIKKSMENPAYLGDMSLDTVKSLTDNGAVIWNYFDNDEFVASMMFIPGDENLVNSLELDIDYRSLGEDGPMFVNPRYRGNGLQYKMLKEMDKYAVSNGYRYMLSTVDPNNIYSSNNLLKDDYQVISRKTFKRGVRDIFIKRFDNSSNN